MLSNSNNSSNQKTFTLPTYINKKIQSKTNTRYGNVQNKSSAPIAYNIQNNQFLYKSENRKGYNQMKIPSFSKNNDILLINPNTYTTVSKGKITSPNSINWNNIGFKEIKCQNSFKTSTYKPNLINKNNNNLFSSYNLSNNYGAMAKNLGFYNINANSNNNSNNNINRNKYSKFNYNNNNNLLYSKKIGLKSNSNNNSININNKKKDSLIDYYKKINEIKKAREGLNSKIIKDRMSNEDNIKKINKIQAVWKGIYVRELMSFYWNFYKFQKVLENFINNQYKKKFLANLKKKDLIDDLIKKKKEYNNLMNEYDKILKQFNELKNNEKNNNKDKTRKNKLRIEKKTQFKILKDEKEEENNKLKQINNKKDIDYINNLKIINNDNIIYEKTKKENIYEKNHTFFSIVCHIPKENKEINVIEKENNKIFFIENQKGFNYEQNKLFNKADLSVDKNSDLNIYGYKPIKDNKEKKINYFINERFQIFGQIKSEKKQENENNKLLLISNQNEFMIKNIEKNTCDKTTETINEKENVNNLIKPNKNIELLFKGIKSLNKDKKEKKENKQIFKKENNSIEIKKKENKQIYTKENNFIEFKQVNTNKKIKNYNSVNEIEKGEALEINPYEIKRTKIPNKISQQNNIEVIVSNNIFTEKSKNNLAKIIFIMKLKQVFINYMKKKHYPQIINKLRKIALMHALIKIKKNYEMKMKKIGMKRLKEKVMIIKIRKYFKVEMEKYEIKKMVRKYLYKKWNQGLINLSKIIINNKK